MTNVTEAVAQQYSEFPYPAPDNSWSVFEAGDPSIHAPLLWPEGRPRVNLRILIAGCGTIQAARFATHNPSCHILAIDISDTSLAALSGIKAERNLHNLEVRKLDLHRVSEIGEKFDLIISTGVLHHLENPVSGLRALASVLDPNTGVMSLMLYGAAARAGVYLLQDAFRRLGVKRDAEGVDFVKRAIELLPRHHYFNWYNSIAADMKTDAGVVDTLLHVQDRAYSVPEVLAFVEDNGLHFQSWLDGYYYQPISAFDPNSPIYAKVSQLPEREQWSVVESFGLKIGRHCFLVTSRDPSRYRIDFSVPGWENYVPVRSPDLKKDAPGAYRRGRVCFGIKPPGIQLLDLADGKRTISEILSISPAARSQAAQMFASLHRLGHIMMSNPIAHGLGVIGIAVLFPCVDFLGECLFVGDLLPCLPSFIGRVGSDSASGVGGSQIRSM
jgi:SAM-dependent methyltransferase